MLRFIRLASKSTPPAVGSPIPNPSVHQDGCSDTDSKLCGSVCIPKDYSCCPDGAGGCPSQSVCRIGINDKYGCCILGEICPDLVGGAEEIPTTPAMPQGPAATAGAGSFFPAASALQMAGVAVAAVLLI